MAHKESIPHQTHRLINSERQKRGLAPAKWSNHMYSLAKGHAHKMARKGYLFHSKRFALSGGENCWMGAGYKDGSLPEAIVSSWMHSKAGHREWLLHPQAKTAAIGIAKSKGKIFAAWSFSDQPLHPPKHKHRKISMVGNWIGILIGVLLIVFSLIAFSHGIMFFIFPLPLPLVGILVIAGCIYRLAKHEEIS